MINSFIYFTDKKCSEKANLDTENRLVVVWVCGGNGECRLTQGFFQGWYKDAKNLIVAKLCNYTKNH